MIKFPQLLALQFLAFASVAHGQYGCSTNADNTLTITNYTGPGGVLTIPTSINGLTVTGIAENAFYAKTSLSGVTIPGSINSIGNQGFYYCTNLTNVSLEAGVASLGIASFSSCLSLPSIVIPDSITNGGDFAFAECIALTNVVIGKGLADLKGTFNSCIRLGSVTVPATITNVHSAFAGCSRLTNITIPPSLTNIQGAFEGCTGLTNFVIPNFVTGIGQFAFAGCTSLGNIVIPESVTNIDSNAFESCTSLGSVTIPASVRQIAGSTIPVNTPSGGAFVGCASLTNLSILGSPTLGECAFYDDPLTSVYIYGGVIGERAFQYSVTLTSVTFGSGSTSIGAFAFLGASITNLAIPDSVTCISDGAFEGCANLTDVVIGAGLANIEDYAFDQDPKLTNVLFLGNAPTVVNVGDQPVFAYSPTTVYYLPGTTGWSNTFGTTIYYPDGAPTVLWNPLIQTSDGHFGVRSNQFGFNITGTANIPIVVKACANLSSPVWTPVTNVLLTNGSYYFSDPQRTNYPTRFYGIGFL